MIRCENASTGGHSIITPQCWNSRACVTLEVRYHGNERDVLLLCLACCERVEVDARRHGYRTKRVRDDA
jgi:hypothetical protein